MEDTRSTDTSAGDLDLEALREATFEILHERGFRELAEPVRLASGEMSHHFIDGKEALARGAHLATACRAFVALARARSIGFDAVGGLTLGADQFAHGIALVSDTRWFVVRKEPKGRGTDKLVEGTPLGPGDRVLLVDDVISTGGSIRKAYEVIVGEGAEVVLATALVDRGDRARPGFARLGVPYEPLLTYEDFGIEPVGGRDDTSAPG